MHAELDPGTYPTGVKVSDAQLAALPLTRHDWHGDWNYTLRPQPPDPARRRPAARPAPARPGLARHPAITGLPARSLDALTAALTTPAGQLREAALDRRRGTAPASRPGTGRRPQITLTGKILAAILHHRHGLPQRAIAALSGVRHELISRHIGDIRLFLHQTGHTIQPSTTKLATLDDLYRDATAHGIPTPAEINTAC